MDTLASMSAPDAATIERFRRDGFVMVERLLGRDLVARINERIDPLFAGRFETGIWPDEWHWRPGMSLPDVTRQMANVWKSDLVVAGVALSAALGRLAATLAGWPGARIGQDTLWVKTPGAREVALHQDAAYIEWLDPPEMTTCWIALDDTSREAGTIEYVPGSHLWPIAGAMGEFHAPEHGHRQAMRTAAAAIGIADPEVVQLEVPAGTCVVHHGRVWHGSDRNRSPDRVRRSLAVHLLSSAAQFARGKRAGYIYGRYQRVGDTAMDESFFPVTWARDGYRTPFLADYCRDAMADG
jgi:phytanoyl-CoA hydroxylase